MLFWVCPFLRTSHARVACSAVVASPPPASHRAPGSAPSSQPPRCVRCRAGASASCRCARSRKCVHAEKWSSILLTDLLMAGFKGRTRPPVCDREQKCPTPIAMHSVPQQPSTRMEPPVSLFRSLPLGVPHGGQKEQQQQVTAACSHDQRRYPPIRTLAPKRTSTQRLGTPYPFLRTSAPSVILNRFPSPIPS
jgi:hypothetical protein